MPAIPQIFRHFLCLSLSLFCASAIAAQCTNVNLFSQLAVNTFRSTYHCTKITGTLTINGADITNLDSLFQLTEVGSLQVNSANITNFDGLNALTKINGPVAISFCPQLTEMFGLESVESTQDFYLANNDRLATLQGLNKLKYVAGQFQISDNPLLLSLQGLESLDSVAGQFKIQQNNTLQSLAGIQNLREAGELRIIYNMSLYSLTNFHNLSTIPGGVYISLNTALVDLGDFPVLKHVTTRFFMENCPLVASLNALHIETITADSVDFGFGLLITDYAGVDLHGLESLTSIEGRLYIGYNPNLRSLDGLQNLTMLHGHLGIESNTKLNTIDAIQNLDFYGGEIEISDNDSLSNCSIMSVCQYLDSPDGLVLVFGNGNGCGDAEEIKANCSPVSAFDILEANLYVDKSDTTTGDIRLLSPNDLAKLNTKRAAVATDGVSTVLLRAALGTTGYIDIDDDFDKRFEFPWSDSTYFIDGKNYLFMLYTPQDTFDETQPQIKFGHIDAYNLQIPYQYHSISGDRDNHFTIPHVRPAVILMHGTYSDPVQAWKSAANGGLSMYDRLSQAGFKVFTVNYQKSNGTVGFGSDISSFADNAKVLWGDVYPENKGGIKDALTYYRDSLGIAATRVDVIGHSLGGILPRVYASPQFNPDYKRPANFMKGDINRLITLGSTHYGSHLGELQLFLNGLSPFDIGTFDWLTLQGVNLISNWVGGASPSHAVMDQLPPPMGTVLGTIGRTEVPSHAIIFTVPKGGLRDSIYDPDESYYDMYWYTTTLMYQLKDVRRAYENYKIELSDSGLQADTTAHGGKPEDLYPLYTKVMLYKNMIEDGIAKAGLVSSLLDGTYEPPSDQEIFKYLLSETNMADYADPLYDIFVNGEDPVGVAVDYFFHIHVPSPQSIILNQLKVNESTIEALRSLMFNNDDNDGVVRVQSQSGELEKECQDCVSHFDKVLHGFAPRYPMVQDKVVDLLKGNMEHFAPQGFPPIDHSQKIYYPPESLDLFKVPTTGGEAICQSGIVPSHARALAHIADKDNVIMIMRPVNPDGTELIDRGAATKGMDIKPKSSNWGPQKGYLPVKQRYSKIWKVYEGEKRDKVIHKYDSLAQRNIIDGVALARQLIAHACNGDYYVYIDQAKITGPDDNKVEDEVVLIPVNDPTKVCYWGDEFSSGEIIDQCEDRGPQHQLIPFEVMASPEVFEDDGVTPRFLTADYDMLMTGFFKGEDQGPPMPPTIPFRPKVGQITPEQEALVAEINAAVGSTGYKGGAVVHHGPENQFDHSPYIDYPLTVFAPDNIPNGLFNVPTDGLILSIEMGPPGFRDINLKEFVNRMRRAGYDLYQNIPAPGWKWKWNDSAAAFELGDDKELGDYVEQLPKNECSKFGGAQHDPCPAFTPSNHTGNEPPTKLSNGGRHVSNEASFTVMPGIVADQNVYLNSDIPSGSSFTWMMVDPFGHVVGSGRVCSSSPFNATLLDASHLSPGIYTIVTDIKGEAGRFVKL